MNTTIDKSKVNINEKDIEDYLWENPNEVSYTNDYGDEVYVEKWVARQLQIQSGILDLFGVLNDGRPIVVEVKNVAIDAKALAQVSRYANDISMIVERRYSKNGSLYVQKVVIGTSCDDQALMEADALGVYAIVFNVRLSLSMAKMGWKDEFLEKREGFLNAMSSKDDLFCEFDELFRSREKIDYSYLEPLPEGYFENRDTNPIVFNLDVIQDPKKNKETSNGI